MEIHCCFQSGFVFSAWVCVLLGVHWLLLSSSPLLVPSLCPSPLASIGLGWGCPGSPFFLWHFRLSGWWGDGRQPGVGTANPLGLNGSEWSQVELLVSLQVSPPALFSFPLAFLLGSSFSLLWLGSAWGLVSTPVLVCFTYDTLA